MFIMIVGFDPPVDDADHAIRLFGNVVVVGDDDDGDGKTEITGVGNEPWHYRYVGVEAAKDMKNTGLCLEEYLEAMEESERET